jgi:virginiamycin B lyase
MDRRSFHRNLLLAAVTAPVAAAPWGQPAALAAPGPAMPRRRSLTEYELPPAAETHEMIKLPGKPMALVSQMSNSTLVKLQLYPATEQVTGIQGFPLGRRTRGCMGYRFPAAIQA